MTTGIGDFLVWFNRRRLAKLVEQAGGELQAEMLVCERTGLQPTEYHAKTVAGRIAYLKRALGSEAREQKRYTPPPCPKCGISPAKVRSTLKDRRYLACRSSKCGHTWKVYM